MDTKPWYTRAALWFIIGTGRAILNVFIVLWWIAALCALAIPHPVGPAITAMMLGSYFLIRAAARGFFPPGRS